MPARVVRAATALANLQGKLWSEWLKNQDIDTLSFCLLDSIVDAEHTAAVKNERRVKYLKHERKAQA